VTFTPAPLDFRSDTVTRPDDTMRAAMASAEVGDNVLERDPTIAALEERAAHVLGMPAALWVPSGTMANLIALSLHLQRGDRFLATRGAHVLANELGAACRTPWSTTGARAAHRRTPSQPRSGNPGHTSLYGHLCCAWRTRTTPPGAR
jgi:cystathionine beta-lyase/cystathionine gamma-synthase